MSTAAALATALEKAIGANDEEQAVTDWIDTGYPPLNKIISGSYDGGLPYGRLVEMYGESSSGKTALATQWMVAVQRLGGVAIFIDWELSFNVDLAKSFGLNDQRPYWIYARPKTWERGNTLVANACKVIRESKAIPDEAPILAVFDSVAAAIPLSVAAKEIDEYTMNDTTALARVTSTTLKANKYHAAEYQATFLYLNQTRTKPGVVYGDPTTTPGGRSMEFFADARLVLGRTRIMEQVDGEKEFTGQLINIKCAKSKFTKPFQTTQLRLTFDDMGVAHFDMVHSMIDFLIEEGKLVASGPRVTWIDGKSYFKKQLVEKIKAEKLEAELRNLLTPAPAPALAA